jgi:Sec-independent protein translocase protein TatA
MGKSGHDPTGMETVEYGKTGREKKRLPTLLTGATGTSIILVVALVMLFASLAALLLANSLRGQLEETRGQLQDAQDELQQMQAAKDLQQKTAKAGAGAAARQPGTATQGQPPDNTKDRSQDPNSSTRQAQDNSR